MGPDLLLTSLCVLGAGKTPTLGGGFHVNLGKESRAQTLQNGTLPPDGRGGGVPGTGAAAQELGMGETCPARGPGACHGLL